MKFDLKTNKKKDDKLNRALMDLMPESVFKVVSTWPIEKKIGAVASLCAIYNQDNERLPPRFANSFCFVAYVLEIDCNSICNELNILFGLDRNDKNDEDNLQ